MPASIPHPGDAALTQFAEALDAALTQACPMAAADDEKAHTACANALTALPVLSSKMSEPFPWGGQSAPDKFEIEASNRTDFNARIWRRLYLATYAFPGGHTVEVHGDTAVVRIPVQFRNGLDPGSFPYPFWHSADKWNSYQTARELLFLVRGGMVVGALRSAERDPSRPQREMKWDGRWTWEDASGAQPRVTLFSYGFSSINPHIEKLERTYRALEKEMRAGSCITCHSPDNTSKMNPLELFSYPNQALSGRWRLLEVMNKNSMPPGLGVKDGELRGQLQALARKFAEAGDDAFAFDEANDLH
jgi:hypothetical protein